VLGGFVGLLWAIHIVNAVFFGGGLIALGVHPRSFWGLFGILFAPLLHASFAHLTANTVPLVVLGALIMQRKKRDFLTVSVLSALIGGLGIWLIAPAASVHIGASILVFGYLGYMLFRGYFERRLWPMAGSVLVLLLYGGALFGVLPGKAGISWQGHLFGLLGGILAARLISKPASRSTSPSRSRIAASASRDLPAARARIAAPGSAEESVEEEMERLRRRGT
jgi:membrane associated rhomboid family serine protease